MNNKFRELYPTHNDVVWLPSKMSWELKEAQYKIMTWSLLYTMWKKQNPRKQKRKQKSSYSEMKDRRNDMEETS